MTTRRDLALAAFFALTLAPFSCVHETPVHDESTLKFSAARPASPVAPQLALDALQQQVGGNAALGELVVEIEAMLQAQLREEAGAHDEAHSYWTQALQAAHGSLGEVAWQGWLRTYVQQNPNHTSTAGLATAILTATKQGLQFPYLGERGLNQPAALTAALTDFFGRKDSLATRNSGPQIPASRAPEARGLPKHDRLLLGTAKKYCKAPSTDSDSWKAWTSSLQPPLQRYWQGLVERCRLEPEKAIAHLKVAAPALVAQTATRAQGIEAYRALVKLLRHNDSREVAATYYLDLMKSWKLSGLTPATFGWTAHQFLTSRIDDALWAARYRAFSGDYATAKEFAHIALSVIDEAYTKAPSLTPQLSEDLADLQAEAYHTLAFRIALEEGAYAEAIRLSSQALQLAHLPAKWRSDLLWYKGLYAYLNGQLPEAIAAWEDLEQNHAEASSRSKALFWLARTYGQTGQHAKQNAALVELASAAPLGYYHVVGPSLSGLQSPHAWQSLFGDPMTLARQLSDKRAFDLSRVRAEPRVGRLLGQTELLLAAQLPGWASLTAGDLYKGMRRHFRPVAEPEAYLYVSRLLFAAGQHARSSGITAELIAAQPHFWQQTPEQILVFFPRPYQLSYQRLAAVNELEAPYLYAVSRQESSFDPTVVSHANAIGLMQVIPPTARRLAPRVGMVWDDIKNELTDPDVNIALGGHYIRLLKNQYGGNIAATFAAYNAGAQAVDTWMNRRFHPDPLVWVELIPFAETRHYVQLVWRNLRVYQHLGGKGLATSIVPLLPVKRHAYLPPRGKSAR